MAISLVIPKAEKLCHWLSPPLGLFLSLKRRRKWKQVSSRLQCMRKNPGTKSPSLWIWTKQTLFNMEHQFGWSVKALCSPWSLSRVPHLPADTSQNTATSDTEPGFTKSCKKSRKSSSIAKLSAFMDTDRIKPNMPKWEEGTLTLLEELNSFYRSLYFLRLYSLLSWIFSFGIFFVLVCSG